MQLQLGAPASRSEKPGGRLNRFAAALCVVALPIPAGSSTSFVSRAGNRLFVDGNPFRFVGANAFWLVDDAATPDRRPRVDKLFSLAKVRCPAAVPTCGNCALHGACVRV